MDKIPEIQQYFITDLDVSQEEVILSAQYEKGVVVHGPPGTGKSQVIANLVSQALANNKKVLIVCQKRVALDVVYQRLEAVGIAFVRNLMSKQLILTPLLLIASSISELHSGVRDPRTSISVYLL
ncbi:AAA domain-containing protein [Desulfosporosinus hippei]|uniref:Part of AAA domain-containing protein n=1 Tax=Desulfosporosinus hippei DSM 8344 TaxID=1121419 RepID=A0A1G8CGY2_9FIRM|nr:AAA domain-containing protein [Desulfosporosinus hippei]SDH44659.1 Part of AAA domain-containing protein [Desulfosporosinus hippei DSM 8344]